MMVFQKAVMKALSLNSFQKLVRPAKVISFEPSQCRKASTKANRIGPRVKTAKPMKLGAMKE